MTPANSDAFQQMLIKLRENFLDEMPERLDLLESLLLEMEKHGVEQDKFNEFYRIIHSLKGSGGTFGFHIITTICHQLEDLLNSSNGGETFTEKSIAVSLSYVDLLRQALEQLREWNVSFTQIEEQLVVLRKQVSPKKLDILIVDDSKLLTQMYVQAFSSLPVRFITVADGYLALMRALTEPFDLIISTNEIPVLNGIALIGAIKLCGYRNNQTPAVLVTSNPKISDFTHRTTDADYVLVKNAQLLQNLQRIAKTVLTDKLNAVK